MGFARFQAIDIWQSWLYTGPTHTFIVLHAVLVPDIVIALPCRLYIHWAQLYTHKWKQCSIWKGVTPIAYLIWSYHTKIRHTLVSRQCTCFLYTQCINYEIYWSIAHLCSFACDRWRAWEISCSWPPLPRRPRTSWSPAPADQKWCCPPDSRIPSRGGQRICGWIA